ncbi:MAG: Na+/H+ antiporter subunit E [Clostridia bacterium]|nr:Na+/H+ antiporter subunit E [Clostridia bacterium]
MALLIFLFWLALNGRFTVEIACIGAAVTAAAFLFLCRACDWSLKKEGMLYRVSPRIALFLCTVIWEIVKANIHMIPVVWKGRPEPVVRHIQTDLKTSFAKMALANAITLTPGTISLSCVDNELTVHCLTGKTAQGLDENVFERRLKKIEEALHG